MTSRGHTAQTRQAVHKCTEQSSLLRRGDWMGEQQLPKSQQFLRRPPAGAPATQVMRHGACRGGGCAVHTWELDARVSLVLLRVITECLLGSQASRGSGLDRSKTAF